MSIEEIKAAYPNEWVMLGNPVDDERMNILSGDVLAHHPDKRTLLQNAPKWYLTHKSATHIYTGVFEKKHFLF